MRKCLSGASNLHRRGARVIGAASDNADKGVDLWRGMRNVTAAVAFADKGGTELAPMSTTTSLEVAMKYAASADSILFKLQTNSFMDRGADLQYLSAFPAEAEVLFPPLTFLRPTGVTTHKQFGLASFTVIEVEPRLGT